MARIAQKHKDKETRTYAIEALGRLGGEQAVDALMALLSDSEESYLVRSEAAAALGDAGDRRAVDALKAIGDDEHEWIVHHAQQALSKLGEL
jgi:HEAT repeat protein